LSANATANPPLPTPHSLRTTLQSFDSPAWRRWLLALAVLAGVPLRFWNLAGVPSSLNEDESVYAYDAYSIFHTGRDHHGHPFPLAGLESFGPFSGAVLSFLEAPAVGVLGLHVWVVRAVPALVSLITIPCVAWLGLLLFDSWLVGLTAAWVVALLPWDVENARFANLPAIVPAMAVITLLLLIYAFKRESNRAIVFAALAGSLAMATYHTMKVYLPLLALASVPMFWRKIRMLSREAIAYAALVFAFVGGPVLFLTAFDPAGRARASETMSSGRGIATLASHYFAYFSPSFLFTSGDGDPMHTPSGYGVLLWTLCPFLAIGLGALAFDIVKPATPWRRSAALFLLAALVLYPFPGCFTKPNPNVERAVHVIPVLALIAAVGVRATVTVSRRLARRVGIDRRAVLLLWVVPALAAFGFEGQAQFRNYFTTYPGEVSGKFQYGLEDAVQYALAHQTGYDQIWVTGANQPYIYVLFEASWPPSDVHQHLNVVRGSPGNQYVKAIGKFRFPKGIGQGPPIDIKDAALPILETIVNPATGKTAYVIRGGTVVSHGRVLVIERPPGTSKPLAR